MKEIYCKDKSVCIKNVGCVFQFRNFGKIERYFVDFIHYVSDLGGHWTQIRGCEKEIFWEINLELILLKKVRTGVQK